MEFGRLLGRFWPIGKLGEGPRSKETSAPPQSPDLSTLMKASWGMLTLPNIFIFFFASSCFSRSLRFWVMVPGGSAEELEVGIEEEDAIALGTGYLAEELVSEETLDELVGGGE